ncbi:hypothetical protein VTO73DRAFT_11824 [Trametes versicolor]
MRSHRFVDRDMYMRYLGGGVGHRATWRDITNSEANALRTRPLAAPEDDAESCDHEDASDAPDDEAPPGQDLSGDLWQDSGSEPPEDPLHGLRHVRADEQALRAPVQAPRATGRVLTQNTRPQAARLRGREVDDEEGLLAGGDIESDVVDEDEDTADEDTADEATADEVEADEVELDEVDGDDDFYEDAEEDDEGAEEADAPYDRDEDEYPDLIFAAEGFAPL